MISVSDTSIINYLILIGQIHLLPLLFKEIHIPKAVFLELTHSKAPRTVKQFMDSPPGWIKEASIQKKKELPSLSHLDEGEKEVILLAKQIQGDLILMDEMAGRGASTEMGFQVMGTLGVLELGDLKEAVDLPQAIKKLRETNFNVSSQILQNVMDRHKERKSKLA